MTSDSRSGAPIKAGTEEEIWVLLEPRGESFARVGFELLSKARELSEGRGWLVRAVSAGDVSEEGAARLAAAGAQAITSAGSSAEEARSEEAVGAVLAGLARERQPAIVLSGATDYGRVVMPLAAARLETGLTADCVGLGLDDAGLLLQTVPGYGGKVLATITCPEKRPQMATVRPGMFQAGERDAAAVAAEIWRPPAVSAAAGMKLLEFTEAAQEGGELEGSKIVVAGGRGLGSADNFRLVGELAGLLGGAVGATRPPVDEGWAAHGQQIGQTGRVVSPRLYMAFGISGAIQHLVGMQSSDVIVAVNKDPDAPIFGCADYGIVGDAPGMLRALLALLEDRRGEAG